MSENKATVTPMQMALAAKNDSTETFEFGGRTFKLLDLQYDSYIEFMEHMAPFIELVMSPGASGHAVSVTEFVKFAGKSLPRMAVLMLNGQDPTVTEEWVKANTKNPYTLAELVLQQVVKNKMIEDFAGFFVSLTEKMTKLGLMT